jgi:hypothetical protein
VKPAAAPLERLLVGLSGIFGSTLVAAYLHGSAARLLRAA